MSEPWTSGPWKAGGVEEVYGTEIFEDNNRALTLAAVADHGLGFEGQAEANARLIAAAPRMAKLLARLAHPSAHGEYLPEAFDNPTVEIDCCVNLTFGDVAEARALLAEIRGTSK